MPTEPIPIGANGRASQSQPMSGSPAQPFAGSAVGLSTSTPGSLFGRWNAFSTTGKSPSNASANPVGSPPTTRLDIPPHEDRDNFDHDSLEFGDLSELKKGGWAAAAAARGQRRAVSMSMSPNTTFSTSQVSPMNTGFLNDKMARGNGVLRRLSLSGGLTKQPPSSVPAPPNPTPIGSLPTMQPGLAAHPPPPAELSPNTTPRGAAATGRRRFSESGARKRGVSPMGERLLRDQVHF